MTVTSICSCDDCTNGNYAPNDYTVSEEDFLNLDKPRPLGITGHLRAKNEGLTLVQCIESCIVFLDELIITYNDSEDNTEEIILEYEKKYPEKIKAFHYKPPVCSPQYLMECKKKDGIVPFSDSNSVHNLANYYNFGYVKTSYMYYMKIDGDQVYFKEKMLNLRKKLLGIADNSVETTYAERYIKKFKSDPQNFGLVFGGVNLIMKDDNFYVPLDGWTTFNGCDGDHTLWIPNSKRRYFFSHKMLCELIVTCGKPKFYGFVWVHFAPIKYELTQGVTKNIALSAQMPLQLFQECTWCTLLKNRNFRHQHLRYLKYFINPQRIIHFLIIGKWWDKDSTYLKSCFNDLYFTAIKQNIEEYRVTKNTTPTEKIFLIAFITHSLHEEGGVESLLSTYYNKIDKSKFDINLCLYAPKYPTSKTLVHLTEQQNQKFTEVSQVSQYTKKTFIKKIYYIPEYFKKCFIMYKNISTFFKNNPYDIVHLHSFPLLLLPKFPNFFGDAKLFFTCHSDIPMVFKNSIRGKYYFKYCKQLIKNNNLQLVAIHETMRQELNEMFGVSNTVVIRNGIDMERFNPERYKDSKVDFKKSLGFQDDDYIVGHVARLSGEKNHKFLIDLFAKLLKQKPDAKLLLVGEGELRLNLQQQINHLNLTDKVVMTGSRSDIPELLSVMDVFVFPSIYEGLPVTLVEAQAMGVKCVVSSAVPKEAHLTENYITLDLEQSHEEWCNAILDDTIRTIPVDSLDNYDMREVVKQLEELYNS